ncbi:hypothetical protein GCM10019016_027170 [Streptomyces prasinosporus]|uniref:4'-phosphopantetheinyl transferase superfamily protein n=1 Tax=Streptomyces prasinosporus TaxID=68256 RepID=A0ABP6TKW9_9ACTN
MLPDHTDEDHSGRGAEHSPAAAFRALRARHETHVWWWRQPLRTDPADLCLLGTAEFEQALRLRAERDAMAHVRTRATVRRAVGFLLGVPPEDVGIEQSACRFCDDPRHERPRLSRPAVPLAFGLARTRGHTALAVGTGPAIGVAAKVLRPMRRDVMREPWLTADEALHLLSVPRGPTRDAHFYRCWTRKEAVLRALGHGRRAVRPDQLESHPGVSGTVLLRLPGGAGGARDGWLIRDLALSDRVAAACAQPARTRAGRGPIVLHRPDDPLPETLSPGR